jgi:transposase
VSAVHFFYRVTLGRYLTLVPLPASSPELNPVERVWLYLKERFLSHRLHADYDAIVDAACIAY